MDAIIITVPAQTMAMVLNNNQSILLSKVLATRPKMPFMAYLYCPEGAPYLKQHDLTGWHVASAGIDSNGFRDYFNGRVVAKCVVDEIEKLEFDVANDPTNMHDHDGIALFDIDDVVTKSGIEDKYSLFDFSARDDGTCYSWGYHILQPTIFGYPKELSDFYRLGMNESMSYWEWARGDGTPAAGCIPCPKDSFRLKVAPQDLCYIDIESEENQDD